MRSDDDLIGWARAGDGAELRFGRGDDDDRAPRAEDGGRPGPAPGEHAGIGRRRFLAASVALGLSGVAARGRAGVLCGAAVATSPGPFYPGELPERADLVVRPGRTERARGSILRLSGVVRDRACRVLPGAVVEIWQADSAGRYKHRRAPEQDLLDPHFAYFGRTQCDADGVYRFRTIVPTSYRFAGVTRAAHIHIRIAHPDHGDMITEMYFAGAEHDRVRRQDRVFQERPAGLRDGLIVERVPIAAAAVPQAWRARFDMQLG
ncbi:hypothetical protein [Haliangium sp.]|uniref:dioxygenase family protein n=1 Tax=Haliangium sp. TaxID=2663208 RepID=UPI003D097C47